MSTLFQLKFFSKISSALQKRVEKLTNFLQNFKIPPSFTCFFLIYLTGIVFFEFLRLGLWLYTKDLHSPVPAGIILQSFGVGWRFDSAITCYLIAPLFLIGHLPFYFIEKKKGMQYFIYGSLLSLFSASFFLSISDFEFFPNFNSRLNGVFLEWFDTPRFIFKMAWQGFNLPYFLLVLFIIIFIFSRCLKLIFKSLGVARHLSLFWRIFYYCFGAALLFLGMRGRIAIKAPLTWGVAYFSENNYANQLALNSVFTFFRDVWIDGADKSLSSQKVKFFPEQIALDNCYRFYQGGDSLTSLNNFSLRRNIAAASEVPRDWNVIIIIMESFGASKIHSLGGQPGLSPEFDHLAQRGLLFDRIYSNGFHTHTGLFATLFSCPILPGRSIMKKVEGQQSFAGLSQILVQRDYNTLFFTTHDPHFDNMQGFLVSNGFQKIISQYDYDPKEVVSTLGVPDGVLYRKALEILSQQNKKFLAVLLTSSNHGPWYVPPEADFERIPDHLPNSANLNCFKYSDWAVGQFLEQAKNYPFFKNTLFVITADNGNLYNPRHDLDLSQFHIPLLFFAPELPIPQGQRNNTLGGQIDIGPTILDILQLPYTNNTFGRTLLDQQARSRFAIFFEAGKQGMISDSLYLIDRWNSQPSLYHFRDLTQNIIQEKSYSQNWQAMQTLGRSLEQTFHFMVKNRRVGL